VFRQNEKLPSYRRRRRRRRRTRKDGHVYAYARKRNIKTWQVPVSF
jgi:hypothetical protein